MKSLATVIGYLSWFLSQFIGTALLGILLGGREHLYGQTLFCLFIIHTAFWGVMQVGLLHARFSKIESKIDSIRDQVSNLPTGPVKW